MVAIVLSIGARLPAPITSAALATWVTKLKPVDRAFTFYKALGVSYAQQRTKTLKTGRKLDHSIFQVGRNVGFANQAPSHTLINISPNKCHALLYEYKAVLVSVFRVII